MDTQPELDPQTARVLDDLTGPGAVRIPDLSPPEARAAIERFVAKWDLDPQPEVGATEDFDIPGGAPDVALRSRLYRPAGKTGPLPILVFVHAGGFVFGSIETHDSFCRLICAGAECLVLSFEYRLAPEHKFPAAVDDALDAYQWVSDHAHELDGDATRMAIAGDSAGGNVTAVTAIGIRDEGDRSPLLQVLIYPVLDGTPETSSHHEFAEGMLLTRGNILWFYDHYMKQPEDVANPRFSPILAEDLSGLAPTLLIVAGHDPLRDEGLAYGERLKDAGVTVELSNYEGMVHGFLSFADAVDQGKVAIEQVATALRTAFSNP